MRLPRPRFTVRRMMAAVAILGPLFLLVHAIQLAREAGRLQQCQNNLRMVSFSLLGYAAAKNEFPCAALPNPTLPVERRLSWMVALTPYFDYAGLSNEFDRSAAWDSPSNARMAIDKDILHCPTARARVSAGQTNWVGVTGVGADSPWLPSDHPRAGVFGFDRATRPGDIRDGVATTLVVVETTEVKGYWTEGGGATVRPVDPARRPYIGTGRPFGGLHPGGANAAFADGSVRFLSESLDPKVFEALSTIAGGESLPTQWDR